MILRELSIQDQLAFEKFLDAWDGTAGFSLLYGLIAELDFKAYLNILNEARLGHEGTTNLFAFVEDEIIGKVSVRHRLYNQYYENLGGHIGYGVLGEHRQKGYASEMLKQSLHYCQIIGLSKVLLTCDELNVASAKIILKNGGVLESIIDPKDGSSLKKRFWIQL